MNPIKFEAGVYSIMYTACDKNYICEISRSIKNISMNISEILDDRNA